MEGVKIFEVRFHGRGGMGAWTATQILALAAIREGKHAQSFPLFGPEREGAPVEAYARISTEPIRLHCMIESPDAVVVLDPTLMDVVEVSEGLKENGYLIVNSRDPPSSIREKLRLSPSVKVFTVPATDIAVEILGRGITNTAMLGAFARATNVIKLESLTQVVTELFTSKLGREVAEKNVKVIRRAYEEVKG